MVSAPQPPLSCRRTTGSWILPYHLACLRPTPQRGPPHLIPHPAPADQGGDWEEGQVITGVRYKAADGQEAVAAAHLTVVCDGMYSTLRTKLSVPDIQLPSYFVGVLLKVRCGVGLVEWVEWGHQRCCPQIPAYLGLLCGLAWPPCCAHNTHPPAPSPAAGAGCDAAPPRPWPCCAGPAIPGAVLPHLRHGGPLPRWVAAMGVWEVGTPRGSGTG